MSKSVLSAKISLPVGFLSMSNNFPIALSAIVIREWLLFKKNPLLFTGKQLKEGSKKRPFSSQNVFNSSSLSSTFSSSGVLPLIQP